MANFKEELKKILEDLANAQRGNMGNPEDYIELCSLNEAISAITELVKGIVPKPNRVNKVAYRVDQAMENKFVGDERAIGFNSCRSEILKRLG